MSRLRRVGAFAYDFVVGDDWRVAAGSVAALLGAGALSLAGLNAWWFVPVLVPLALWWSLTADR